MFHASGNISLNLRDHWFTKVFIPHRMSYTSKDFCFGVSSALPRALRRLRPEFLAVVALALLATAVRADTILFEDNAGSISVVCSGFRADCSPSFVTLYAPFGMVYRHSYGISDSEGFGNGLNISEPGGFFVSDMLSTPDTFPSGFMRLNFWSSDGFPPTECGGGHSGCYFTEDGSGAVQDIANVTWGDESGNTVTDYIQFRSIGLELPGTLPGNQDATDSGISSIPEPSTFLLLLGASLILVFNAAFRRWRKCW